jgi:hypothetical protein
MGRPARQACVARRAGCLPRAAPRSSWRPSASTTPSSRSRAAATSRPTSRSCATWSTSARWGRKGQEGQRQPGGRRGSMRGRRAQASGRREGRAAALGAACSRARGPACRAAEGPRGTRGSCESGWGLRADELRAGGSGHSPRRGAARLLLSCALVAGHRGCPAQPRCTHSRPGAGQYSCRARAARAGGLGVLAEARGRRPSAAPAPPQLRAHAAPHAAPAAWRLCHMPPRRPPKVRQG